MKRSNNSLLISIHNTTPFTLQLSAHDIQRGTWKTFPPDMIESGNKAQFGAESQNFAGSLGSLSYVIHMASGGHLIQHTLPFSWTFSVIGKPQFKHKIWSMSVLDTTTSDNHFEVELTLSSEESFVIETEFTKIIDPTFEVNALEEDNMMNSTETKPIRFFLDEDQEWADSAVSDAQSYPEQLELLD
jgi:hypothetical protein